MIIHPKWERAEADDEGVFELDVPEYDGGADVTGRCPSCDDTGDVHTFDGRWLGACDCPAGRTPLFNLRAWLPPWSLLLPAYAGPTLLDYRPIVPLPQQYPRPWPPVRHGRRAWLRWTTKQMIADPDLRVAAVKHGVRATLQRGGKQPDWERAFYRDVVAVHDRRRQALRTDPTAREFAARYGTSTLTDVEHWHAVQLVEGAVDTIRRRDELWQQPGGWLHDTSTFWLLPPNPYLPRVL